MTSLLILYTGAGLLLIILAVPLIQRRVPPNIWYGFRLPQTLNDPEIWYAVNEYGGRGLLWVGIITLVTALGLYFVLNGNVELYASVCASVILGSLLVDVILSLRYLGTLKKK
ncbi:MAG: SdpI family protein [Chloroflexi bacterium]|nr:SdpI family protein [Chloroflexota bacterium]